jgi:hypothetical protein
MVLPTEPVTLSVEQVKDLNQKLSNMRHDINNHLSLILAGAELARHRPELLQRMAEALLQQPPKIAEALSKFSEAFEKALGISRP